MEGRERLIQIFSKNIREILGRAKADVTSFQEIRMRAGAPLFVIDHNSEYAIGSGGELISVKDEGPGTWMNACRMNACRVTAADVEETLECAARYSLYAFEEELRQGFITVAGGCRIGVAGRVVMERGSVRAMKPVTFLNVRFSHQIYGCADRLLPYLYEQKGGELYHTLLISPPRCGKTTLLRDIVRQVSDGNEMGAGKNVGVVDERSEIGACFQGIPQNDVGMRTDVLDCCPKAAGMMMLIRSMAPSVVAVDEIGGEADLDALRYVLNCGCRVLATVHGTSMEDIRKKPGLWRLLEEKVFGRYVVLNGRKGAGTIEDICDEEGRSLLCGRS